jgi:tRNA pseudouridine38-40 synthase
MSLNGIDFEQMNKTCQVLVEYSDFTSFSKLHTDAKTNICRIDFAGWEREGRLWVFTIKADRFLRNMVRAIVGTLLEVGRGKRSLADFRQLIEAKNRCMAGTSAPAKGLSLMEITYPAELFLD